jgi:hypothetical protein
MTRYTGTMEKKEYKRNNYKCPKIFRLQNTYFHIFYSNSTVAPASANSFLNASASSFFTASLITVGAFSTKSLAYTVWSDITEAKQETRQENK